MRKLNDYKCTRSGEIFERFARDGDEVRCKYGALCELVIATPKRVIFERGFEAVDRKRAGDGY